MTIDRILIRGTNWLGDAVMTTPALERLRRSFPGAEITLLATPLTAALFQGSSSVNNIIEYRRREEGVKAFFDTVAQIRARRFDLAVLFQNAFEAALLAALGGARLRIGFAGQGRGWLLTHRLHRGARGLDRHQIHDYLDIVAECERVCLGEDFKPAIAQPLPLLTVNAAQNTAAAQLLDRWGLDSRLLVALNTAATNSRAKCWPMERFAPLADRLIAELNAQIILIGAASERNNAESVIQLMNQPGALNLAGETTMAELIGLLARCDLLVTNDTGPAHVAAALGTPTLTIFGPTNEFETAPTGTHAELIRAEGIECARCMHRDCPIDHRCMTHIAPEDVLARARQFLEPLRKPHQKD
ncbi:MAG: lipopolysaccharide heptosyltransferase II [Blastocatellia bacterium]